MRVPRAHVYVAFDRGKAGDTGVVPRTGTVLRTPESIGAPGDVDAGRLTAKFLLIH